MWKYFMVCMMIGAVSCRGSKTAQDAADEAGEVKPIQGQWLIENVVENDSSYVRPSEIEPGMNARIDFNADHSFGIVTNCNHIGGQYAQSNDSISFANIFSTEIACDNMEVEDMLKAVLPHVNTIDCINDSITRLNTDRGEAYIVLKKADIPMK